MRKYIAFFVSIFTCATLGAWPVAKEAPFIDGEELLYEVSYKAALIPNTVVAQVKTRVNMSDDPAPSYHIWSNAAVMSHFKWFFDMSDTYEIWLDSETLLPLRFENDIKEGKYTYQSNYRYDWDSMRVHTFANRAKWDKPRIEALDLTRTSMDPLSTFFNLRGEDIEEFEIGKEMPLELVFAKKIRNIKFKFLGRETLNLKKMGKFNTLKFACQLADDDGQSFKEGSEFFVWLTDDDNKIPLYLESPVKVGSVKATIAKMKNLKYPLTSKIK